MSESVQGLLMTGNYGVPGGRTYLSGPGDNTPYRREPVDKVQELTPEPLWWPGFAIPVRGLVTHVLQMP